MSEEQRLNVNRMTVLQKRENWSKPLVRVLEGHEDLVRMTSSFPKVGRLPGLIDKEWLKQPGIAKGPETMVDPGTAIVVVVVCVAVAARPGAVTDPELLRAKLLDVYSPYERETLREAVSIVQKNPDLVKTTLGIDHSALGKDFMGRLNKVETSLV
jgi:hypothetical protein